jgi:hypothetical protein
VLFDLQSPRRRNFIRVVYAMLAVLMGGGLLLFGIGGGGGGGILDAVGLTNSSGGSGSANFDPQIKAAEAKVAANPQDPAAVLALVRVHVSAGSAEQDVDPNTGQPQPSEASTQEFQKAADAWDRYLKLNPKKVDFGGATLIAKAYISLAETSATATEALSNIQHAAKAQRFVADAQPSQGSLSQLAIYEYFAGDTAAGDAAAKKAAAATQPAQASALKQQLAQFKSAAAKFQQQVAAAEKQAKQSQGAGASGTPGANPFQNPLGSSGGAGGAPLGGP